MRSALLRSALGLLLAATLVLAADWGVWSFKRARGQGYGEIPVTHLVVAPLKGGREEYYTDGTAPVRCSRSLAPHAGLSACWWLNRHRVLL